MARPGCWTPVQAGFWWEYAVAAGPRCGGSLQEGAEGGDEAAQHERADAVRQGAVVHGATTGGVVGDGVALAAAQQGLVHRVRGEVRNDQGERHGAPEEGVQQAGVHGAGDQPHDEVVHDLHGEDGDGVRGEHEAQGLAHADARAQQGQGGQGVAEHEGQGDGHGSAGDVAPPEHSGQDQAEDLTDGAAGEAVEGGAGGHVGHVVACVAGGGVVVHVVAREGVRVIGGVGGGGRVHAIDLIP